MRADDQPARLVDDGPGTGDDIDAELSDDEIYPTAQEASVRVVEVPPGATDRDIDSYTGEPVGNSNSLTVR